MITASYTQRPYPPINERIGILGGMRLRPLAIHGDFYAEPSYSGPKSAGVGNYLHRANASEFSSDTPFHTLR